MNDLRFRRGVLTRREHITPRHVRVTVAGPDLVGFDSPGADDHVRVFIVGDDPAPTVEAMRAAPSREYTPAGWDAEAGTLDLEFALHDGVGVASEWAARAEIGSSVGIGGPRASVVLTGRPDSWFLAGDETAVPAMRRLAGLMDDEATGTILVEVEDARHELPISAPAGVAVTQLHRDGAAAGLALAKRLATLDAADRPFGTVVGFIAAEQSIVRHGRALLRDRWTLDPDATIVKGYWKRGTSEYHAPH